MSTVARPIAAPGTRLCQWSSVTPRAPRNGHRLPLFAAPDVAPCGLCMKEIRFRTDTPGSAGNFSSHSRACGCQPIPGFLSHIASCGIRRCSASRHALSRQTPCPSRPKSARFRPLRGRRADSQCFFPATIRMVHRKERDCGYGGS